MQLGVDEWTVPASEETQTTRVRYDYPLDAVGRHQSRSESSDRTYGSIDRVSP